MNTTKLTFIITLLASCLCSAKVEVINHTRGPIKVLVHFIGIGSPSEYELKAGESMKKLKDLANIKKRYQVWVSKKNGYELVVDEKVSDSGAFRFLEVYEREEPESGEIMYGIYSRGG